MRLIEVGVNFEDPKRGGRRRRGGARPVLEVDANGFVVEVAVEECGRSVGCRREELIVSGESAVFILVKQHVEDVGPRCEGGERRTVPFLVESQLHDARGCGPNLDHVFPLFRLVLEVLQVGVHGLKGFKSQDVGAVAHFDVHEQGSHLVGEVRMDSIVRFRCVRFR